MKPGQTRLVSLSPLSENGDTLAIKVPVSRGRYYLIENRQPVGFDEVLPDSGILILKVDPKVQEGSGTVRVVNANPDYSHYSQAAFRLDRREGNIFVDEKHDFAVIPLWRNGKNQNVLVTTPEESANALRSALLIQELLALYPEPRAEEHNQLIKNCIGAFRDFDFGTCRRLAEDSAKDK